MLRTKYTYYDNIYSPQILTTFSTLVLQRRRQRRDELFEMSVFQRSPYLLVGVHIKRIKVHA